MLTHRLRTGVSKVHSCLASRQSLHVGSPVVGDGEMSSHFIRRLDVSLRAGVDGGGAEDRRQHTACIPGMLDSLYKQTCYQGVYSHHTLVTSACARSLRTLKTLMMMSQNDWIVDNVAADEDDQHVPTSLKRESDSAG